MQSGAAQFSEWIEKRGYKQLEVANLLGISEGFVSMIRSGVRAPGRNLADRISILTGIPMNAWSLSRDDKAELVTAGSGRKPKFHKR